MRSVLLSRRRFLMRAAISLVSLPIGIRALTPGAEAKTGPLPRLPPNNPQAKALGYVEDATTVKRSHYKVGSDCSNCQFFTAATGACSLFPGFSVATQGWCTAWAKRSIKR
jgi:hypothetical protein